jgi:hypothetical protein
MILILTFFLNLRYEKKILLADFFKIGSLFYSKNYSPDLRAIFLLSVFGVLFLAA